MPAKQSVELRSIEERKEERERWSSSRLNLNSIDSVRLALDKRFNSNGIIPTLSSPRWICCDDDSIRKEIPTRDFRIAMPRDFR
jgi:hypothetical protein